MLWIRLESTNALPLAVGLQPLSQSLQGFQFILMVDHLRRQRSGEASASTSENEESKEGGQGAESELCFSRSFFQAWKSSSFLGKKKKRLDFLVLVNFSGQQKKV